MPFCIPPHDISLLRMLSQSFLRCSVVELVNLPQERYSLIIFFGLGKRYKIGRSLVIHSDFDDFGVVKAYTFDC